MNRDRALLRAKRHKITNRIDMIRNEGTEAMRGGMKAVFGSNQYKPKRKEMWEDRLKKGALMVAKILENREDEERQKSLEEFGGN